MTDAPESLQVHVTGPRVRAVLRPERDERKMRPFFFGLIGFALLAAFATRAPPEMAPFAYIGSFLLLIATAPFGVAVLNPPQDLDLDDRLLQLGNAEITLTQLKSIDIQGDGKVIWLTIQANEEHRWMLSAAHHSVEDLEWLADVVRSRARLG
jgi:hypothetical protein